MSTERVLRFEVPSRETLERLATGPLPRGLKPGATRLDMSREIYFDTAERDLERRGVTVRVCVRKDGSRLFTVNVRERATAEAQVIQTHAEAVVPDEADQQTFAGSSEPARLLRALIDPTRLEAQLELGTMRWYREASLESAPDALLQLACDQVTVRHGDISADFQELEIRLPGREVPGLDEIVGALQAEHGLRVTLASTLVRAWDLLEELDLAVLELAVQKARRVAVVAHHGDEIALFSTEEGLRIPTGQGWGEDACRQVLSACFGRSQGQLRRLGASSGIGARPALEVWLAERVVANENGRCTGELVWLPFEEVIRRVGSTELRDSATLTAIHHAARAGLSMQRDLLWHLRLRSDREHPFQFQRNAAVASTHAVARADAPARAPAVKLPPDALINQEMSELAFQRRVLALAEDVQTPLLERVRFLSILGSNVDEFFMTRVAGFHQQVASGSDKRTLDGLTPEEQLDLISIRVRQLYAHAYRYLWNGLVPELEKHDIQLLSWNNLGEEDRQYLLDNYTTPLGAVLTPLVADPSHPFPHIRNLRPALGVIIRVPETRTDHFAAVELPGDLPRFVPLPGGRRFIPLEEVVAASLPALYFGLEVVSAHPFRVTRSANFTIDDEISDLLQAVEEKVHKRPLGPVVRLEVEQSMPEEMREMLLREFQFESRERTSTLRHEDVFAVDRLVDLYGLREIASLPIEEFHYPPLQRQSPLDAERPLWPVLRERNVLVHFPYDSFEASVERMLAEAARDDNVISIKVTLYRTNRSSRVVKLLRRARRTGKEVVALIELKASFDEKRNIEWARALESSGIHVVYGPAHLKVHAKLALVVRREKEGIRRYLYIGTGNLNAATAAAYTDLGLLTTDPELGNEVNDVFHSLTGYSIRTDYEHLLVAPFNMRDRFLQLIDREIEHARAGRGGRLTIKLNGLSDSQLIAALYQASQAGVRVELIVRGLCSLRPGVPGLSENITVISILGRFLEHARIYRFDNAGNPEHFIGSADWRPRNLSRRVEVVTPVRDPNLCVILDDILEGNLANPEAWELMPDGEYVRRTPVVTHGSTR